MSAKEGVFKDGRFFFKEGRIFFKGGKCFVITFCHFLSLSVTFCHFLSLLDQLLGCVTSMFCAHQCLAMPLQGIVTLYCSAFKLSFFKTICSKLLKGVNAHFLSLSVTFCHFLSLLDQLLGGVTSMFCAHQCLCKPSCYVAPCWSIIVFTKTTEMGLVTGNDFSTMLSLLKTLPKSG